MAIVTTTTRTMAPTKRSKPNGMKPPGNETMLREAQLYPKAAVPPRALPLRGIGSLLDEPDVLTTLQPAFELPLHDVADHPHAILAVVEAGQVGELLAAVVHEDLAILPIELLEGFEAVGREARRDDRHALDAALGQGLHGLVRVGLEPLRLAEARLEAHAEPVRRPAEGLLHQPPGLHAMAMVGIALQEIFLGHPVEGDEDHLRLEGQLRQIPLHRG